MAGKAAVRPPSQSNALTDFKSFCLLSQCGHRACHLMPGHEGILGHTPVVIEHREIRVAESAVANLDFHFFGSEWTRIESEGFQL